MCLTGGIISGIFEVGLEGCWKDLLNSGPASERKKACDIFKLLGKCQDTVEDTVGNLVEPRWLKVISFEFPYSNDGDQSKSPMY